MEKSRKTPALILILAISGSIVLGGGPANARVASDAVQDHTSLSEASTESVSESLQLKADPFVMIDNGEFKISPEAKKVLTEFELSEVERSVYQSNELVSSLELGPLDTKAIEGNHIRVTSPEPGAAGGISTFANGKNAIEFHWGRVDIFISKNTIATMGAGISIAGIWLSAGFIDEVLATLGVVAATVPHGIVISGNYGELYTALREGRRPHLWSVRFQL
ncbi:hypothetical protein [Corynebacterium casei]|uniref:hypothetical protein n=1 Tax=Corynebacterium casei TaxID=160386 RepID=UPI003F9AFB82